MIKITKYSQTCSSGHLSVIFLFFFFFFFFAIFSNAVILDLHMNQFYNSETLMESDHASCEL